MSQGEKLTYEFTDRPTKELLRELILYIATRSQLDPWFGKTKLVKLLYLSDFGSFREYGTPITGHRYLAWENGPMPVDLYPLLDEMIENGELFRQTVPIPGYSHPQERFIPLREVNADVFNPDWESIAYVDGILAEHEKKTGSQMANLTHGIAWKVTEPNSPIPYESSIIDDDDKDFTPDDIAIFDRIAAKYGIATG